MSTVIVNIKPLLATVEGFRSLARVPAHPAFEAMFSQWTARYSGFSKKRYNRNALGAGDWEPLALSTIRARKESKTATKNQVKLDRALARRGIVASFQARDTRRGTLVASPKKVSILKDTEVLFGSLTIGAAGNAVTRAIGSVTYSIGGTGQRSVIARAHQDGNTKNRMPARRILVQPDEQTLRGLRNDAIRAVRAMSSGQSGGGA